MNFECSRDNLHFALVSASKSVGSKSGTDDLSGFVLFRVKRDDANSPVSVLSFNRVSVSQVPVQGVTVPSDQKDGHFTADAHALLQCLQAVPDGEATVAVSNDGKLTSITAGLWTNHLPSRGAELWPFWDDRVASSKEEATLETAPFVEAITRVSLFASKDESHEPHLCAVYCWDGRVVANSKLAYGIAIGPFSGRFIVPSAAIRPLSDFLRTGGDTFTVLKHPNMTTFRRQDGGIFGVFVQQGFQNVTSRPALAVDDPAANSFTASRDQVRRAIDFLFTAAAPTEKFVGFQMDVGQKTVHLSTQLRATSKSHSIPVSVEVTGADQAGRFSKDSFEAVLSVWGDAKITFDLIGSKSTSSERRVLMARVSEPQDAQKTLRYVYLLNGGIQG